MRYVLLLLCCIALAFAVSTTIIESKLSQNGYVMTESPFRDKVVYSKGSDHVLVHRPYKRHNSPYDWAKQLEANQEKNKRSNRDPPIGSLPDDYYRFVPDYIGSVRPGKPVVWSSPCYKQMTAELSVINQNGQFGGAQVTIHAAGKKDLFCDDGYLLATVESFHVHYFEFTGNSTFKYVGDVSAAAASDIQNYGVRIFRFQDDVTMTIVDVWETLQLFMLALIGKGVPAWTAEDNVRFLKDYAGWDVQTRTTDIVTIDENQIQSGAFLGIIRMDGLDPTIAWGMGSHTGHTAITLRINGTLYVCESTSITNYWPYQDGLQKTPWKQWLQQAHTAGFNVVMLPLAPKYQQLFDEKKAAQYFATVEGLPYGFHNMLFTWIDTPQDNYPPPLTAELVMVFMVLLNQMVSDYMGANSTTYDFWAQALNQRLNTNGLTIDQAYAEASSRGISFTELVTIPEQDDWIYEFNNGVKGTASVCDVIVMRIYKAAGIFGNIADQIQGTEFTNWDVYSLNIFDGNYQRPPQCVQADPSLPYCQLMGKYRVDLNNYNQFQPFPHMREHCPGIPPLYTKPANC